MNEEAGIETMVEAHEQKVNDQIQRALKRVGVESTIKEIVFTYDEGEEVVAIKQHSVGVRLDYRNVALIEQFEDEEKGIVCSVYVIVYCSNNGDSVCHLGGSEHYKTIREVAEKLGEWKQ